MSEKVIATDLAADVETTERCSHHIETQRCADGSSGPCDWSLRRQAFVVPIQTTRLGDLDDRTLFA